MIVTFCGHADFSKSEKYEKAMMNLLETLVGNQPTEMYLGDYGRFDDFAYECCKKYKDTHPDISLVFVTPYLSDTYLSNRLRYNEKEYDFVLFPEIEDKVKRYAIVYRNKYMVERADFLVAYVLHDWGGAYRTYKYAKRKRKVIFNLANPKMLYR